MVRGEVVGGEMRQLKEGERTIGEEKSSLRKL